MVEAEVPAIDIESAKSDLSPLVNSTVACWCSLSVSILLLLLFSSKGSFIFFFFQPTKCLLIIFSFYDLVYIELPRNLYPLQ